MAMDCHCGDYGHSWECGYHSHWREEALERKRQEEEAYKAAHPPGWMQREFEIARERNSRREVLEEVSQERYKQNAKWGEQNHPDLDPVLLNREGGCSPSRMAEHYEIPSANRARTLCDMAAQKEELTWAHILIEEVAEVVGTNGDVEELREELVQVAAVAVAWIQAIDRRSE